MKRKTVKNIASMYVRQDWLQNTFTKTGLHCRLIGSSPTFAGNAEFDSEGPMMTRISVIRHFITRFYEKLPGDVFRSYCLHLHSAAIGLIGTYSACAGWSMSKTMYKWCLQWGNRPNSDQMKVACISYWQNGEDNFFFRNLSRRHLYIAHFAIILPSRPRALIGLFSFSDYWTSVDIQNGLPITYDGENVVKIGCKWTILNASGTGSPLSHPFLELDDFPFLIIGPLG